MGKLCFRAAFAMALWIAATVAAVADKTLPPAQKNVDKCRKELRELFSTEYQAATTPASKQQLAQKLLDQGANAKDPAEQYAMLDEARTLGLDADDDALVSRALVMLAERFEIDVLAIKSEALAQMSKRRLDADARRSLTKRGLLLMDEAVAESRFEQAHRLAGISVSAARASRDAGLVKDVSARIKELDRVEKAYKQIAQQQKTLEQSPADPAANLAVGKFLCFIKGDFRQGLPMLLLSEDEALSPLADRELARPKAADEQLALAEGWLAYGEKQPSPVRQTIRQHAAAIMRQALPELDGLARVKTIKTLDKIDDSSLSALLNRSKPLYYDEFENTASGFSIANNDWSSGDKKAGTYGSDYQDGKWFIFVDRNDAVSKSYLLHNATAPWTLASCFACEAVGRVATPASGWSLAFENDEKHKSLRIAIHDDRTYDISPNYSHEGPRVARTKSSALRAGTEFNILLVVMTPRQAWIFFNGVQAGDPLPTSDEFFPARLKIAPHDGTSRDGVSSRRAEFERIRVWDQTALPAHFLP